ncbi:ATP-binding protein [Bacillus sp. P14.5]|uniref:sensor histidine kinase n=1 Tax=Bacillus sp. P14.5 TaxID=1983400 RepID=UPI000DE8DFE3|nr:ATP-binding protein [Bacillus sp. P14.5]
MNKMLGKISFRNKITSILLFITLLLSGYSLVLVESIDQVNEIGTAIRSESLPEVLWLTHWEKELAVKEHLAEGYLLDSLCCGFLESYDQVQEKSDQELISQYGDIPEELTELRNEISLLDFNVENKFKGLILYNNERGAEDFIRHEHLPLIRGLRAEISNEQTIILASLNEQSEKIPDIIKKSLWLLIILTSAAVTISFMASYRISASLTNPLEKLTDGVRQIKQGKYGLLLKDNSQLELEDLTSSINEMSVQLKSSFQKIIKDKSYREQIMNTLPVGIITVDERKNSTLNDWARKLLLIDEDELSSQSRGIENRAFWSIFLSEQECRNKKVIYTKNNADYTLLVSQTAFLNKEEIEAGRIFYFVDITDTEKLEKRIHQSEKLAAIGEIAAGAAHEIRNPLTVIHGFISLMGSSISSDKREQFRIPLLMKEIERINFIIEEMLMLSKPGAPIRQKVFLEDILGEILPLIRKQTEARVSYDIHMEKVSIAADVHQVKQVFHNLIRNSVEAMEGEGTISITSQVKDNHYVIYFKDDGPGIPKQDYNSLFQPFYSTKVNGTGLGLTIVQRIIENHGGTIEADPRVEKGTLFIITLPVL